MAEGDIEPGTKKETDYSTSNINVHLDGIHADSDRPAYFDEIILETMMDKISQTNNYRLPLVSE